ncbi:hypothetical protein [Skermania sp. ID1734]|uniref:hypothetical protein n=1 Tax=Skermania sp. ID1734 TaxID=2597516 RepID=UPI00163D94AD|nr:hypothetical protein [Skermania sp. ID1734]
MAVDEHDVRVFGNGRSWSVRMRIGQTAWESMGRYPTKAEAIAARKRLLADYGN